MSYVNQGDYSYWKNTKTIKDQDGNRVAVDRDLYTNGEAMANVIFPANPVKDYEGDIVPIGDNEGKQFAYAWWRDSKESEARMAYGRLKSKGYEIATPDGFRVVREQWFIENGRICHGDTVLMACTAERYDEEERKEALRNAKRFDTELESIYQEFSGTVSKSLRETGIALEPITEKQAKTKARR